MMRHYIWVFTVCQSTHLETNGIHRVKQDQTLLWTCVAGARRCVNSRYAKFKYTGMKSDNIQISQCNLQLVT